MNKDIYPLILKYFDDKVKIAFKMREVCKMFKAIIDSPTFFRNRLLRQYIDSTDKYTFLTGREEITVYELLHLAIDLKSNVQPYIRYVGRSLVFLNYEYLGKIEYISAFLAYNYNNIVNEIYKHHKFIETDLLHFKTGDFNYIERCIVGATPISLRTMKLLYEDGFYSNMFNALVRCGKGLTVDLFMYALGKTHNVFGFLAFERIIYMRCTLDGDGVEFYIYTDPNNKYHVLRKHIPYVLNLHGVKITSQAKDMLK